MLPPALPVPVHDPERVRAVVDDVLADPAYRRPSPSLFERGREWLTDRLGELVDALVQGGTGSLVAWAIVLAALAVVGVVAVRVGRGLAPAAWQPVEDAIELLRRGAAEWRAEAVGHEAAGRFRDAVRCRYGALLADLAARGMIEERPGRTAGEYQAEAARALPVAAGALAAATDVFQRTWYGGAPATADDVARLSDAARRVADARMPAGVGT